jgi:predicted RND superfamily exporter protein
MNKYILFIAVCFSIIATAQHDIVYNLEKGGVYPQNQSVISEQNQIINGMPQEVTTTVSTESDYVVRDIKDGIYYIDIMVKKYLIQLKLLWDVR